MNNSLPSLTGLIAASGAVLSLACVPSIPPCECGADEGTGSGGAWPDEAQLDRSEDCELAGPDECGYPQGPYGPTLGDVFPNIQVENCAGASVEFAQLLNIRPDTMRLNRGVIFAFGAGWCAPCVGESEHFAEIAADYRVPEYDTEFLHLIIEGTTNGSPADTNLCSIWEENTANSAYPIWYTPDPTFSMTLLPPGTSIPYVFVIDANANVRFAEAGTISDSTLDQQINGLVNNPYG